jgi:hypothetical protein|tara:strand:- start:177 stop:710 length:534 start_codon:yes stop_codon:yes gene_type:complete
MAYFMQFPFMGYDIKGDGTYKMLPDILRRVKLRANIRNGMFMFDNYDIQEGETPEIIAFKWFGDTEFHWVVLMTNNITDRYYQWPLTQPQFQTHLEDKYGVGNIDAVHHYEITQSSGKTSSRDSSHLVEVNSDASGAASVTNREYEQREQDEIRQIRLLQPKYLGQFVEEFIRLIRK